MHISDYPAEKTRRVCLGPAIQGIPACGCSFGQCLSYDSDTQAGSGGDTGSYLSRTPLESVLCFPAVLLTLHRGQVLRKAGVERHRVLAS